MRLGRGTNDKSGKVAIEPAGNDFSGFHVAKVYSSDTQPRLSVVQIVDENPKFYIEASGKCQEK